MPGSRWRLLAVVAVGLLLGSEASVLRAKMAQMPPPASESAPAVGNVGEADDASALPRAVASLGPSPETALVELDADAKALVGHGEHAIVHFLLHVVKIPGVSNALTSLARTAATSISYTALDRATASLRYAQYTLWSGATAVVSTLFTVATCVISLNVPGLLVALPSLIAQITSFITSWMRLRKVRTGVEMQSNMCSTVAPLLARRGTMDRLHTFLLDILESARVLDRILVSVGEHRSKCDALVREVTTRYDMDSLPTPPPEATCDARVESTREKLRTAKAAFATTLEKVEKMLGRMNEAVGEWRATYFKMVGEWERDARGMTEEELPMPLKMAQMFNRLTEWITSQLSRRAGAAWTTISGKVRGLLTTPVAPAGDMAIGVEVGQDARVPDEGKVLRWSPKRNDYVLVERKKRLQPGQGASLDSIEYDNTIDDVHQAMSLTMEMVRESSTNPFHMPLDRTRIQLYGTAKITNHRVLEAAGTLPHVGPLILEPLWEENAAGVASGESGWRLRIAPPTKPKAGEERSLYDFRHENLEFMTETYCMETSGLVMRDVLKSPDKAFELKKEVTVTYHAPWFFSGGISCMTACDPRILTLFSVVPSFPVLAFSERASQDLDKLDHGRGGKDDEFCVSLYRSRSESNPLLAREWAVQEAEESGISLPKEGGRAAQDIYAFSSLGNEKLKICTNNAAEAMVWFCTMANIGVRLPALGLHSNKALLFVAGSSRVQSTMPMTHNIRFGGAFVDRTGNVAVGADVRSAVCTEHASVASSPRPLLQSVNEFDAMTASVGSSGSQTTSVRGDTDTPALSDTESLASASSHGSTSPAFASGNTGVSSTSAPLSPSTRRLVEEEQQIATFSAATLAGSACRVPTTVPQLDAWRAMLADGRESGPPSPDSSTTSLGESGRSTSSTSSSLGMSLHDCEGASVDEVLRRRMSDAVIEFVVDEEVEGLLEHASAAGVYEETDGRTAPLPGGVAPGSPTEGEIGEEIGEEIEEAGGAGGGISPGREDDDIVEARAGGDIETMDMAMDRVAAMVKDAEAIEAFMDDMEAGEEKEGTTGMDACMAARVDALMAEHGSDAVAEITYERCRREAWMAGVENPRASPAAARGRSRRVTTDESRALRPEGTPPLPGAVPEDEDRTD